MRPRGRESMWDEDAELQVFVPGLMATGILVSIGMLIWDGIKRLFPDVTGKQRNATRYVRVSGRVSDLASIELGEAPTPSQVQRVQRARSASLVMSVFSWALCASAAYATLAVYTESEGPLAGRGWTLSIGFAIAAGFGWLGIAWLSSAVASRHRRPVWLAKVESHWPIGGLPELRDDPSADA